MESLLITLLSSVFLSGTIGYISYFILQETADIYFSAREKDEKKAFISLLSVMTFSIIFICYYLMSRLFKDTLDIYFATFFLTIATIVRLDFFTLPAFFENYANKINKKRTNNYLAVLTKSSKRNIFFREEKKRFVYLFTLEGKYITSGTLISTTLESDMFQEYTLQSGDGPSVRSIEELENHYSPTLKFDIFVDVENNLQIYSYSAVETNQLSSPAE